MHEEEEDDVVRVPIEEVLDLHAFAPRDIPDAVTEYVETAWKRGFREVRLVHGRGIGVQRAVVHKVLSHHPRVAEFWDAPESHLGATVARLVART
jgi:DNA-nicking Smr family endonuclease